MEYGRNKYYCESFTGKATVIRLTSFVGENNKITCESNYQQHVTIMDNGLISYNKSNSYGEMTERKNLEVYPDELENLFDKFSKYFAKRVVFNTRDKDSYFELTLINDSGESYFYQSDFDVAFCIEGEDLSELLRKATGIEELTALDGGSNSHVETVSFKYGDYTISLNRLEKRITVEEPGFNLSVVDTRVVTLLDKFETFNVQNDQFETIRFNVTLSSGRTKSVILPVKMVLAGFITKIIKILQEYHFTILKVDNDDLMSESIVKVRFSKEGPSYSYYCKDENIRVGDMVVVPVGYNDRYEIAEVVTVNSSCYDYDGDFKTVIMILGQRD